MVLLDACSLGLETAQPPRPHLSLPRDRDPKPKRLNPDRERGIEGERACERRAIEVAALPPIPPSRRPPTVAPATQHRERACEMGAREVILRLSSWKSTVAMLISDYRNWCNQLIKEYSLENRWIPCTSVICGIFACKLVYDISKTISPIFFKSYSNLPNTKKIEWDNRAISTVHAIFVTALSIYLAFWSDLFADDEQRGPVLFRSSPLSTFILGVSVGYFISDLAMIFWFYPALGGIEYVLHHFLSMKALGYAMLTGEGQFYTYMVLLSETTTPGINLRWYLDAVGRKKSKTYVLNGVAIFLTWLVARVLLFMYVFHHLYAHYDQIKLLPAVGFYLILTAPCVLAVLNLMWFAKITKGVIKTLRAKTD